jgi:hypothetical protein
MQAEDTTGHSELGKAAMKCGESRKVQQGLNCIRSEFLFFIITFEGRQLAKLWR